MEWDLLPLAPFLSPQLQLTSDASGSWGCASGSWGCGAWRGRKWFQLQWDERSAALPITVKELLPIVLACAVWGPVWGSHQVVCRCDNQAVVASLRSRTSRESHIMHMLRTLAFIEARHTFCLMPQYTDTKANHLADDLSREHAFFHSYRGPPSRRTANISAAASTGLTPGPNPRLGLSSLAPSVQHYFQEGLAPSTRRSYDSAMKKFSTFCDRFQVSDPFPVTEHLLCSFAAFMADSGLATQTVKSYIAAIRNTQLSLGLPDPREQSSPPILKRVLAGIGRSRLGSGQRSRVCLSVTATLLRDIRRELERSAHLERLVLWAVCCTAFFGFFRLGELLLTRQLYFDSRLHLSWGDMAVNDPRTSRMIKFHLRHSRQTPLAEGQIIIGRTGCDLCPVAAVLSYVAATSAALAGIEDSTIQLLGRWQSAAFLGYIRTPHEQLASISASLAAQARGSSTGP